MEFTASTITSVTTSGCWNMTACEAPGTITARAPARRIMAICTAGGRSLSLPGIIAHEGIVFQGATSDFSSKALVGIGRCVVANIFAISGEMAPVNSSRYREGTRKDSIPLPQLSVNGLDTVLIAQLTSWHQVDQVACSFTHFRNECCYVYQSLNVWVVSYCVSNDHTGVCVSH